MDKVCRNKVVVCIHYIYLSCKYCTVLDKTDLQWLYIRPCVFVFSLSLSLAQCPFYSSDCSH